MKLNDKAVQAAKPKDKRYKLADGGGLYLKVYPSGAKSFRLKYRFNAIEKRLVFGQYPVVSLKIARELAHEARQMLARGIDPDQAKKEARAATKAEAAPVGETVEQVAMEWMEKFSKYINHAMYRVDNGRVLGYDSAHDYNHRHYMGKVDAVEFTSYDAIVERFQNEWQEIASKHRSPRK